MDVLLEPWELVAPSLASRLEDELSREISVRHALHGKIARAVAKRRDCDDVLFEIDGSSCAVVHLTWSRQPEASAEWPSVEWFSSYADWESRGMKRDHDAFTS